MNILIPLLQLTKRTLILSVRSVFFLHALLSKREFFLSWICQMCLRVVHCNETARHKAKVTHRVNSKLTRVKFGPDTRLHIEAQFQQQNEWTRRFCTRNSLHVHLVCDLMSSVNSDNAVCRCDACELSERIAWHKYVMSSPV